jgi:hypothetical protein
MCGFLHSHHPYDYHNHHVHLVVGARGSCPQPERPHVAAAPANRAQADRMETSVDMVQIESRDSSPSETSPMVAAAPASGRPVLILTTSGNTESDFP